MAEPSKSLDEAQDGLTSILTVELRDPGVSAGKRKRESDGAERSMEDWLNKKRKATPTLPIDLTPATKSDTKHESLTTTNRAQPTNPADNQPEDLTLYLKKIALCQKTSFQKKVLTALCQIPRGQYSTYGALSKHMSSSPRAVGNALRNNPFAPGVPCHRILASGGGIGGFGGSWGKKGEEGKNDEKKRRLLREEGVKFDGRGKVVGSPWESFK